MKVNRAYEVLKGECTVHSVVLCKAQGEICCRNTLRLLETCQRLHPRDLTLLPEQPLYHVSEMLESNP